MDKAFEKLIKVNTQGRVFVTCQTRGVYDPTIIGYYAEILEQEILAQLTEESTPAEFHRVLGEQLSWLEGELDQVRGEQPFKPEVPEAESDDEVESQEAFEPTAAAGKEEKKPTGYVPEAKTMPERLKDRRSIMEHLLDNDCLTLKLVTPDEAKRYKHELLGKMPEKAEEELVARLRNVLHEQVRKFIRKNNGGPWATATLQHEIRMDITKTRSLRSLVTLARELLNEREEWLVKTKSSLTGRFFGGRVKMDK
jgi:hypothetical protein